MIVQNETQTLIQIQTLFYLDKCAFENGSLETNLIATVRSAGVSVFNSTSRRLESVPLVSFGPIAPTEVLRPPQSSLGLIASAKGLHQPLSFFDTVSLDTVSLDNNPTVPFLTTH